MAECQDVTGAWGQPCPTCDVTLPEWSPEAHFRRREEERHKSIRLWRDPNASMHSEKEFSDRGRHISR